MTQDIIFREYNESDRIYLEQIIKETWNYDRFCTPKTASLLAHIYLNSCLANQTFTQVALVGNMPIGIIMGKNNLTHHCPLKLKLNMMKSIFRFLITKEGRKVSSVFGGVEKIDQELLSQCEKDYQGELAFFAIQAEYKGLGIGKQLFQNLVAYMQSQNINNFYLYTDTSCNYGFYEHQGMHRQQEKSHQFNIHGFENEMTFFLYDYDCKNVN